MERRKRLVQLDSLRGLAALAVVFHHCLITFPALHGPAAFLFDSRQVYPTAYRFTYSPLHLLWGGHEAVIFFFILSGFVLALPYLTENRTGGYFAFVVKRFCRIYLPYAGVVIVSGLLMGLLADHGVSGASSWFQEMWSQPITWSVVKDMALMLGKYTHNVDTVTWSLVHEIRISLIFPVLVWFVRRLDWKWSLAGGLLLSTTGSYIAHRIGLVPSTLADSLYYTGFFVAGAVLAKQHRVVEQHVARVAWGWRCALLVVGLGLYNWAWEVPQVPLVRMPLCMDWVIAGGALVIMVLALASRHLSVRLQHLWLVWLGKVSYSLYLVHPVVLLTMVYALHTRLPLPVVVAMVPPISLLVAEVAYRFLEAPSMKLGRRWAASITSPVTRSDAA